MNTPNYAFATMTTTPMAPTANNAESILEQCIRISETMVQQQYLYQRFVQEQVDWLTTTAPVSHITPASGSQVEVPSYTQISQVALASTGLAQETQRQLADVLTSTNPTVVIDDGTGGQVQVPSYHALQQVGETALAQSNDAKSDAANALALATTANTAVVQARNIADIALRNSNPPTYQSRTAMEASAGPLNGHLARVVDDANNANITLYQYGPTGWQPIYDPLKVALGDTRGYKASFTNSVTRTFVDKVGMFVNPEDAGAKGDNVTDDSVAFNRAGAGDRVLVLMPGKTYKLTSNTTVGQIMPNGAKINLDTGATLTFDTIIGDESAVVFTGPGKAVCRANEYSVGWFGGNTFEEKWDFMRRGFLESTRKFITVPSPYRGDPAALDDAGTPRWRITAPVRINAPESLSIVECQGTFVADPSAALPSGMFIFGDTSSPHGVRFRNGLQINANKVASYGIRFSGLYDVSFDNRVRVENPLSYGLAWDNAMNPSYNVEVNHYECNGFGIGLAQIELAPTGSPAVSKKLSMSQIKTITTKGAAAGGSNTYFVRMSGNIDGLTFGNVIEFVDDTNANYKDWTNPMFNLENGSIGTTTGSGVQIGYVRAMTSKQPIIRTTDTSGGQQGKLKISVDTIDQTYESVIPVQLAYAQDCHFGVINKAGPGDVQKVLAVLDNTCSNIAFNGTHHTATVTASSNLGAPYVQFDGRIGMVAQIGNNDYVQVRIPPGMRVQKFDLYAFDIPGMFITGWAGINGIQSDAPLRDPAITAIANTVLNGTTGADLHVTVSAVNGVFYIENRSGTASKFALLFT